MFDIAEPDNVFLNTLKTYADTQPTLDPFIFTYDSQNFECWFDTESLSWKDGRKVIVLRPQIQDIEYDAENFALIYDAFTHFYYTIDPGVITHDFYSLAGYLQGYFSSSKEVLKLMDSYSLKDIVLPGKVVTSQYGHNEYYPSHSWRIVDIDKGDDFDGDYCEGRYYCSQQVYFTTSENEKVIITYQKYNSEIESFSDIESEVIYPKGHCCSRMNVVDVTIPLLNTRNLTPLQQKIFHDKAKILPDMILMRICTYCDTIH